MSANPPTNASPDREVMARIQAGDLDQLGVLFERHHRRLFNYCRRLVGDPEAAQDLVQEVFVRVLKYRDSFRDDHAFLPWIYRTARNACFDQLRKSRREVLGDELDLRATGPLPVEEAERREAIALLGRALRALPDEKREILVLARFGSLDYREIAQVLDCSVGAVKVRVHRAMRQLRQTYLELAEGSPS